MTMIENEICINFTKYVLPTLHGKASEEYKTGALAYSLLINIYFFFGFVLFAYYKPHFLKLQPRSTFVVFVAMLSGLVMTTVSVLLPEAVGRETIPCQLRVWVYHGSLILIAPGCVANLYTYIYKLRIERDRYNKVMLAFKSANKNGLSDPNMNQSQPRNKTITSPPSETSFDERKKPLFYHILDFLNVMKFSQNGKIIIPSKANQAQIISDEENVPKSEIAAEDASTTGTDNESLNNSTFGLFNLNDSVEKNYSRTLREQFMESIGYPLALIIILGFHLPLVVIARIELDPVFKAGCIGCDLTLVDYILSMVDVGTYVVILAIGCYAMRNEQDPLGIFGEIKIVVFFAHFVLLSYILLITDPGYLTKNYIFSWQFLHAFGHCGCYYAISYHPVITSLIEERKRHIKSKKIGQSFILVTSEKSSAAASTIDNYSAALLDIDRILSEPKSRNALLEHAVDELSSENLVFLFKVKAWRARWEREAADKLATIAVNIFNEFVSRDSKTPINIPNSVFVATEKNMLPFIQAIQGSYAETALKIAKPPLNIFEDCEKECVLLIETDTLPRFVQSDIFKKRIVEEGVIKKIMKR